MQELADELAGVEAEIPPVTPEYAGLPGLDDWWPEPDWHTWVSSGLPAQLAADLYFLRRNLPNQPPAPMLGISAAEWARMYLRSIEAMKQMLATLNMADGFEALSKRYEQFLGWDTRMLKRPGLSRETSHAAYGLGKSFKRSIRHPFGLTTLMEYRRRNIATMGWPLDRDIPPDPAWIPVEFVNRSSGLVTWQLCQIKGNAVLPVGEPREDDEDATIDAIMRVKADAREREAGQQNPYDRPAVAGEIQRTGPDWRDGRNITTDEFLQRFRFSGLQFGNWVTQAERQSVLNDAWDALHDLTDICGLPPQAASLNGYIEGLAFGARGKAGAAAHWEPDHRVINLSRLKGIGALAHEWGHAVDNFLGGIAYQSLIDQMMPFRHPEGQVARARQQANLSTMHNSDASFAGCAAMGSVMGAICHRDGSKDQVSRNRSTFLSHARQIDGPAKTYWQHPNELWARAFEAWVHDCLAANGRRSDYLVFGVDGTHWTDAGRPSPYPLDVERTRICATIGAAMSIWSPLLADNATTP